MSSFAWATGGARSYVSTASDQGEAVKGTKSEDTCLVTPDGVEFLTETHGWTSIDVPGGSGITRRPAIRRID